MVNVIRHKGVTVEFDKGWKDGSRRIWLDSRVIGIVYKVGAASFRASINKHTESSYSETFEKAVAWIIQNWVIAW